MPPNQPLQRTRRKLRAVEGNVSANETEPVTNAEPNQLQVCFCGRSMSDMGR